MIALPVPCLVTCSNDMNDPRIPTLKGIMGAKKKEVTTLDAAALGGPAPTKTRVLGFEAVPDREPGQLLQGEAEEIARLLVGKLHNEARVL
jgi:electron transfer flavoprotein beta subunit